MLSSLGTARGLRAPLIGACAADGIRCRKPERGQLARIAATGLNRFLFECNSRRLAQPTLERFGALTASCPSSPSIKTGPNAQSVVLS
jgi:hypothetical protein